MAITKTSDSGTQLYANTRTINFADNIEVVDDGNKEITVKAAAPQIHIGKFRITSTGTQTITGIPFAPDMVEFHAEAPVEGYDTEESGGANSNTTDNFTGSMTGFARNDNGTTVQQVISSGGSGNSINAIRQYSSSSRCIGITYGDQNGNEVGQVDANLSSWNNDGFDINVQSFNLDESGIVVIYKAYKR